MSSNITETDERDERIYQETYSVETAIRLSGVSGIQLIRYERARLVLPLQQGDERFYRASDLQRIRKVRRLQRDLGINLAGIAVVLRLTEELAEARQRLAGLEQLRPDAGVSDNL